MKSNIKILTIVASLLFVFSCGDNSRTVQAFEVEYKGALKNIMFKGDLSAKTKLLEYKDVKNLYALGAVENLKGEIQIFNSQPINSYVENGTIKFDSTYLKNATLFVKSVVTDWVSIQIPEKVKSKKKFEKYLNKMALENKIDVNQPFPFLIEGKAAEIDWHVINWNDGDTEHTHEKHISSGLYGTIENEDVTMLGFYSDSHHAIFTHHTTNMHIHMKQTNGKIAGHVDGFNLGPNMTLKLPKNQ